MKIPFLKHNKRATLKQKRFNPHHFWIWYIGIFVLLVIFELMFFSWYFLHITTALDAPAAATLQSNASKIKKMQKTIDTIDAALKERVGEPSATPNTQ